ncbi:MAG: tyrosine-protein phosphatase [Thermomicrobiales bacterium]
MNQRSIDLPGVFNFRDIGGYPTVDGRQTRWKRLYRSGDLHRISAVGVRRLEDDLGLKTVVDIRWPDDLARSGTPGRLAKTDITRHHVPFGDIERLSGVPDLPVGLAYLPLVERCGDDTARIVQAIAAQDTLPAVVHCSAGKDRTGLIIALLLALLGVDDETIVEDYSLTARHMPRWIAFLIERGELPPEPSDADPHPGDAIAPEAIQSMLDSLRTTHGSIEGYFLHHGLEHDSIDGLRALLIE